MLTELQIRFSVNTFLHSWMAAGLIVTRTYPADKYRITLYILVHLNTSALCVESFQKCLTPLCYKHHRFLSYAVL
mgnify:CR=1 FL=1